jgi:D-apionolactonase
MISTNMIRYGSDAPLPPRRTLRAGPLSAVLENGDLRYIRLGDVEVVRRLYMAVRDQNWATIEPVYKEFTVHDGGDHFRVDMVVENVAGDVDFAWAGTIIGTADGTIRAEMDGSPRASFLRNRIGFCVLHPMDLAGEDAVTETPRGTVEGAFPDVISPHQPFLDMISIRHAAGPEARVTIRFEGDLFEMEDQRNWTDASFKTYSTPLRIPYPIKVGPEDRIIQSITIEAEGTPRSETADGEATADVQVDRRDLTPLPPIGFGAGRKPITDAEVHDRLRLLAPAWLWIDLDLGDVRWQARLRVAAESATSLGATLDLSVIAGPGNGGWEELAAAIARDRLPISRLFVFPAVDEPIVFPRKDLATQGPAIAAVGEAFAATGLEEIAIGGGTRAYFTELNRASETLPLDQMEVVTYTINPQVHAFDNLSLVETIEAQAVTVSSAHELIGDLPLIVGPISFMPPYNPNATGPQPPVGPDELPASVDPRQLSLFGAGWTLGSLHRLARAGVDGVTYFELLGWKGLIEREEGLTREAVFPSEPGQLFPLYHVFAAASDLTGAQVAAVELSHPLTTEALALVKDGRIRILVANLSEEEREVTVDVPGMKSATVQTLDETTYRQASQNPSFFSQPGSPASSADGLCSIRLRPFAVARIDGRVR